MSNQHEEKTAENEYGPQDKCNTTDVLKSASSLNLLVGFIMVVGFSIEKLARRVAQQGSRDFNRERAEVTLQNIMVICCNRKLATA